MTCLLAVQSAPAALFSAEPEISIDLPKLLDLTHDSLGPIDSLKRWILAGTCFGLVTEYFDNPAHRDLLVAAGEQEDIRQVFASDP